MNFSYLDSLLDSIVVVKNDNVIVYINESGARLLESSIKRIAGKKNFNDLLTILDTEFEESLKSITPDQTIELKEIEVKLSTGTSKKVQMLAQCFAESNEVYKIFVIRDVTLEEVLHAKYRKELEQKEDFIKQLEQAKNELENYSKNLEKMVAERTKELRSANQMLSAVMNSLGQGFLTFDDSGQCSNIYTKACIDILETTPANKKIWEVLKLQDKKQVQFKKWMQLAFTEVLPFDSLLELAPRAFEHTQGRAIGLDFFPIKGEDQKITHLVLVSTDKTAEQEAKKALEQEKDQAQLVMKMIQHRSQFKKFISTYSDKLDELNNLAKQEPADTSAIFRSLHTIEGEAGLFGVSTLIQAARKPQEDLENYKANNLQIDQKAKQVLNQAIDDLKEAMQQFKTNYSEALLALRITDGDWIETKKDQFVNVVNSFAKHGYKTEWTSEIIDALNKVPLSDQLKHFNEICEVVAFKQNKKINSITFKGDEILINPQSFTDLIGSFVHVFRNIMDHGIEPPDEREMMGKDPSGTIVVNLTQTSNAILIEISDDGGGIDPQRVRKKLKEKFPNSDFSQESDADVIRHIFDPGFSTRDEVTEFSGRGVGMDAVRTEVHKLGGNVDVQSQIGLGTKFTFEIPIHALKIAA